jgi:hypothetical protein
MVYVPGLEHDVFISYAHIDNEPFGEGQSRWVSTFHRDLQKRLPMVLGDEAVVWRDPRLLGNEVVWEALESRLRECAVLVVVLSPRYVDSVSCRRELDCFEHATESSRGFELGARRRVFKVEKTPVSRDRHPEIVRALPGYEFHWPDPETGEPREFHLHPDPNVRFRYWPKLDDLVRDMAAILREMRQQRSLLPTPKEEDSRIRVYLASTTQDVRDERERLDRELKDSRCEVLPDRLLPDSVEDFRTTVRSALAQCRLSVHLIGANYGAIPEGDSRSVVVLQHELAAERAGQGELSEIIWMRPDVQAREAPQRAFISTLELHVGARDRFEFMRTDVEALKTVIRDRLRALRSKAPTAATARAAPRRQASSAARLGELYLICDRRDQDAVEPLRRVLFDRGFEVTMPLWAGEAAQVREFHEGNLRLCDVAVIFYGQSDPGWFQMKLLDLRKAPGLGRSTPPLVAWVFMGPPRTTEKQGFRSRQFEVLEGFGEFPFERIAELADEFRRRPGGAT